MRNKIVLLIVMILSTGWLYSKQVAIIVDSNRKLDVLVKEGILAKFAYAKVFDVNQARSISEEDFDLFFTIGRKATDVVIANVKHKPILFSMLSAPKYYGYSKIQNLAGVSMDVSATEFYEVLSKILPKGSQIGFIYKSKINEYLTNEIDFIESKYGLKSIRVKVANRKQLGENLEKMIEQHHIKAFWMLPDSLYNQAVFKKLANLCKKKKVLLITPFEPLVTNGGAAFAIAPSYYEIGLQVAQMASKLMHKKKRKRVTIAQLGIVSPAGTGVYINDKTIQALGIKLPKKFKNRKKITELFAKAQEAYTQENYGIAKKYLRKIRKYDKRHKGAKQLKKQMRLVQIKRLVDKAIDLIKAGHKLEALPLLVKASKSLGIAKEKLYQLRRELRPQVKAMVKSGIRAYKKKNYKLAIRKMSAVRAISPKNKKARIYLKKAKKRLRALKALR